MIRTLTPSLLSQSASTRPVGPAPMIRTSLCVIFSLLMGWSQPVAATLYLRGKRWSVGWNGDFIEVLLRQRRRSCGIAGSAGSRCRRSDELLVSSHRRSIFWWLRMVGFVLRSGVAPRSISLVENSWGMYCFMLLLLGCDPRYFTLFAQVSDEGNAAPLAG